MSNRRDFVSGAIVAAIGLALSQGRAIAEKSAGYPLKFLKKTEYPETDMLAFWLGWTSLREKSSCDTCIRASSPAICPWAALLCL
jgi:hypothetical protein